MSGAEWAALAVAGLAGVTDVRSGRIPNVLTFAAMLAGVIFHAVAPQGGGLMVGGLGLLAGLLVFFPIFALGAMGAADVKLMAALGAWLGWQPILYVALYAALAGGVLAIAVALRRGYVGQAFRNVRALLAHWWLTGIRPLPALTLEAGTGPRLPYAVPILAGLVVTLWHA